MINGRLPNGVFVLDVEATWQPATPSTAICMPRTRTPTSRRCQCSTPTPMVTW